MTPQAYLERLAAYAAERGQLLEYRDEGMGGNSPSRAADREWITTNPHRRHRLRPLLEDETGAPDSFVIVRCIPWRCRDGEVVDWAFIKAVFPGRHTRPDDDEKVLALDFDEHLVINLRKPWEKVTIPESFTISQDKNAFSADKEPSGWVSL